MPKVVGEKSKKSKTTPTKGFSGQKGPSKKRARSPSPSGSSSGSFSSGMSPEWRNPYEKRFLILNMTK